MYIRIYVYKYIFMHIYKHKYVLYIFTNMYGSLDRGVARCERADGGGERLVGRREWGDGRGEI